MPDGLVPSTPAESAVRARLHDAARTARESRSLAPDVRTALAELLDELSRTVDAPGRTPAEVAHLAETTAHLTDALHHAGHDRGVIAAARDRLGALLVRAEAKAPTAVGLARQLTDALARMGI
jgi:hypothetical protein